MPVYIYFVISFIASLALTPLVRYAAARKGWMAYPVKDRWHERPTALMGGIAICLSMALPLFFAADFSSLWMPLSGALGEKWRPSPQVAIWVGVSFLFILGLVDDFLRIRPQAKLVGQILIASLMAFWGFRLEWFSSLTLDTVLTIVWIVGITNALNLIDNMDGLCAGVALVASFYFAFLMFADAGVVIPALLLAGAVFGFLFYNFNPASIFMGDCGSLPIGFTLAMLALLTASAHDASRIAAYAVPVMVLLVPILDTTLVTLIRLLSGRKASTGGKDHTSHRLVLMGFSEREAVLFLYGTGVVSGLAATFVKTSDSLTSPAVIIPLAIAVILMGIYMAQIRVYPEKEFSVLRDHSYTPILMELTYKRQILLVILDFWMIAFSYYLAYRLRFSSEDFYFYFKVFLNSLPAIIACKFIAFFISGVYRGFWRFMSTDEVFSFLKASALATLFSVAAVTYLYRFENFSKGIFIIDWLLTTGLLLGSRGSFRIALDVVKRKQMRGEKVLIYGAGRGGEILLREIINNKQHGVIPVGFIDDDPYKVGKKLQGRPVLGTFKEVEGLLKKHEVTGMLISFNGGHPDTVEAACHLCQKHGLFIKRFTIGLKDLLL